MNYKKSQFERKTLPKVLELLKTGPLTAERLAEEMHCSKPTAYRRLRALHESDEYGPRIAVRNIRRGERGPTSEEFIFV